MINKSFDHLLDIILYPKQPPLRPHSYSIPIKASSIEHRTSKDPKVSSICHPLSDARLLFAYCLHSHARLGHHHLKIRPYIMHYAHTLQSRPYTLHQRSTSLTALDTCTYNAQEPPFRVDHFIFSASLRRRSILIRITIECVVSLVVSFYRRTCRIIIVFHLPT